MRNLAVSCPNSAVAIHLVDGNLVRLMNILGPLLSKIDSTVSMDGLTPVTVCTVSAAAECVNVEFLFTDCCNAEVFFLRPKPKLRELRYDDDVATVDQFSDTLRTIASHTGSLRVVYLLGTRAQVDALRALADTNIDLEFMHVGIKIPHGEDRRPLFASATIDLVESLSNCKALRKISVTRKFGVRGGLLQVDNDLIDSRIPSVADACVRFRGRNISV